MPQITDHMSQVLTEQLAFIATVNPDGTPNLGPKGSISVHNATTLVYDETTGGQTLTNLQHGSGVVIAVVDRAWKNGYRFTGSAEILDSGEIFEHRSALRAERGKTPQQCSVLIHLNEISTFRPV